MNWYIVQAYSGFEKKVVESIKDILTKSKLESHLGEILVPTQEVTEVKKGKRTKKQKKYFPGYVLVNLEMTKEQYKKSTAPTINHFYEKLLLLKDKMNTKTGQLLAKDRHRYMEGFLQQFYEEWNGVK